MAEPKAERQPRHISVTSRRGRIIVRTLQLSDAEAKIERNAAPANVAMQPHFIQRPPEERMERMLALIKRLSAGSGVSNWFAAVVRVSDGKNIGDSGLNEIVWETKTANIGIMLDDTPDVRGQGYAVEAMEAIYDFSFNELGLERVEAGTDVKNAPMRGVFEKRMGIVVDEALTEKMNSKELKDGEFAKRTEHSKATAEELERIKKEMAQQDERWYTVTKKSWEAYGKASRA